MTRRIFILLLIAVAFTSSAQKLSSNATMSLITIGPTQKELYSAFGHSGFRVYDSALQIDNFYNYGVFNFNQPNFYLNFARGINYYQLGVDEYPLYRDYYIRENRFIHEQILNLTSEQKQKVFDFLSWNALAENKLYLYDYFYDNCATRPRDVLQKVLGDNIAFDETPEEKSITIRGLTDIYLKQQPWGDLGIDICLGMPMDKTAKRTEYMFLPDSLEYGFDRAKIKSDGTWTSLVANKISVFESQPSKTSFSFFHPLIIFWLVSILITFISVNDLKKGKLTVWLDRIIFITTGSIGLLLLILWTVTSHKAAANNLNVLWALPTNLVFPFLSKFRKKYFLVVASLTAGLLLFWFFLPQDLHTFLIPLVAAFGVRYWVNYKVSLTL
jgi:Domain of unknown function (DUF4105)